MVNVLDILERIIAFSRRNPDFFKRQLSAPGKHPGSITRSKDRIDAKTILFPKRGDPEHDEFLGDPYHTSGLRKSLLQGLSVACDLDNFYVNEARFYRPENSEHPQLPQATFILLIIKDSIDPNNSNFLFLDQNNLRDMFHNENKTPNCSKAWHKSMDYLESVVRPGRLYILKENEQRFESKYQFGEAIQFHHHTTLNMVQLLALVTTALRPAEGLLYRSEARTSFWRLEMMWQAMKHLNDVAKLREGKLVITATDLNNNSGAVHHKTGFWRKVSSEEVLLRADIVQRRRRDPIIKEQIDNSLAQHSMVTEEYEDKIRTQLAERGVIAQRKKDMEEEKEELSRRIMELKAELTVPAKAGREGVAYTNRTQASSG
ncbi:hypothetical protein RhiTH_010838 [Rhizoctonia solani]